MKNVPSVCVTEVKDSVIRFEENRSVIRFLNQERRTYKSVQVDGCAITQGLKCDNLLTNKDETKERFVELKGSDIPHGLNQLRDSMQKLGEFPEERKAYLIFTACSPAFSTRLQLAKKEFKKQYNAELIAKRTPWEERL